MEIVISTYHLGLGGSESYVLTVAEQLQRLGHGVTVFAVQLGVGAEIGRERGLLVCDREDQLPETCDIVFAQESVTAYQLADRYPTTPQVFGLHADEYDLSMPPQLPDVVKVAVVLNERVARRVRALALVPEVIRLRQPVDTQRFRPLSDLRKPARRVLLLGNYVVGDRRDLVVQACTEAGLECVQIGVTGAATTLQPELELCRADIVIGKARVIVEAMACGRAAYVYDHNGGDGWVTPERYALLEADNFGGQAEPTATDVARLRRDLAEYTPEMGPPNRDLAVVNHSANKHAQELVALFQRLEPRPTPVAAPVRELARLVRLQWMSESRVFGLNHEIQVLHGELARVRAELDRVNAQLAASPSRRSVRRARTLARRLGAGKVRAVWRGLPGSWFDGRRRAHNV